MQILVKDNKLMARKYITAPHQLIKMFKTYVDLAKSLVVVAITMFTLIIVHRLNKNIPQVGLKRAM